YPEVPGGTGDLAEPRGLSTVEESDGIASDIPQIPEAPHTLGPGGDAAPRTRVLSNRPLQFTLRVPFQSPQEAYLARRSLLPDTQRHQGIIRKEFVVNGSDLIVRWSAEDLAFIRLSINPFLNQLFQNLG
uniref:L antigen family member 3 n=1 Tax=Capra hircus TaxID=9925 RepID=A0A8C2RLA0_CAPHI